MGRYTFTDIPDGRYRLGFIHPMLDSLGLEPMLRDVRVEGRRTLLENLLAHREHGAPLLAPLARTA